MEKHLNTRHSALIALAVASLFAGCGRQTDAPASYTGTSLRSLYGVEVTRIADKTEAGAKISRSDKNFVKEAAVDGLYEVEVARVASERASDPAVKSFAQTLVNHHSAANDELRQLAGSRDIELPKELPMMKRRAIENLRKTSSGDFDREFIEKVGIKDHEADVKDFEKASRDVKDPEVRAWAEKTLPTLRQHLTNARNLSASLGQIPSGKPGSGTARSGGSESDRESAGTGSGGTSGSTTTR